jgi:hypothetical protein
MTWTPIRRLQLFLHPSIDSSTQMPAAAIRAQAPLTLHTLHYLLVCFDAFFFCNHIFLYRSELNAASVNSETPSPPLNLRRNPA